VGYTAEYVLPILERAIAERHNERGDGGAARIAEELGCNPSLVTQLRNRTYPESSTAKWYRKIVEKYGSETVQCPTLGEIPLIRCAEEKNRPAGAPSAAYARQRRACKNCERRKP
jgi:hypothetical protein